MRALKYLSGITILQCTRVMLDFLDKQSLGASKIVFHFLFTIIRVTTKDHICILLGLFVLEALNSSLL